MTDMDKKMNKFMLELVKKQPNIPRDLELFLITEETYIQFHNGYLNIGKNYEDTVVLNPKKLEFDRGQILSAFSKMEYLLNELFHLLVIDYDVKKRYMFNNILENVNLHRKIMLMNKWGLISGHEQKNMEKLKSVRNSFAHVWNEKEVMYKKDALENNFDEFKKDLKDIWLVLVDIYKIEQRKINLDEIKKKLGMI